MKEFLLSKKEVGNNGAASSLWSVHTLPGNEISLFASKRKHNALWADWIISLMPPCQKDRGAESFFPVATRAPSA